VRIRNFQPHLFLAAVLRKAVFNEDRAAGIGDQRADGQQVEVTGSVMRFHFFSKERGVVAHRAGSFAGPKVRVNGPKVPDANRRRRYRFLVMRRAMPRIRM